MVASDQSQEPGLSHTGTGASGQVSHVDTEALGFEPSFASCPGTLAGNWIGTGTAGTQGSVHTDCWCCG